MAPRRPWRCPHAPCPNCGKPGVEEYRPFCSKCCADVDLRRWLSRDYAVAAEPDDDGDGTPLEEGAPGGGEGMRDG